MGKNNTEIQKRTFKEHYTTKPNIYFLIKTVDSYIFVFFLRLIFSSLARFTLSGDIELKPVP